MIWLIGAIGLILILYLICIFPGFGKRKKVAPFMEVHYAHRGLFNQEDAVENTIPAFKKAVEKGYGIELDVQLSKDGVPVIHHDRTFKRLGKDKRVLSEMTWSQIQEIELLDRGRVPKLEDVLKLINGQVPLIVEYKVDEKTRDMHICEVVDPLLQAYHGLYCIESFHPYVVRWYRQHRPEVVRGQLSQTFQPSNLTYFILSSLLLNGWNRPDFIAYDKRTPNTVGRRLCRLLYGCPMAAWTIKSQEEWAQAKKSFDIAIFDSCELE